MPKDKNSVSPPTWIRCSAVGGDLVEQHAKGPDVRLVGELSVVDGLGGAPLVGDLLVFCDVKWLLGDKSSSRSS